MNKLHLPIWYDYGLAVNEFWKKEISYHIDKCKAVILFLTKDMFAHKDNCVLKEFETAGRYNKNIFCIWLDNPADINTSELSDDLRIWLSEIKRCKQIDVHKYSSNEVIAQKIKDKINGNIKSLFKNRERHLRLIGILELILFTVLISFIAADNLDNYIANQVWPLSKTSVKRIQIGTRFTFGEYEQDGDLSNGKEVIEWEVLTVEDGKVLVTTTKLLDAVQYNNLSVDVTWATCTLRKWMNEDFYEESFTDSEKKQIAFTINQTPANNGTSITKDKIFALSLDELNKYLSVSFADTTDYADGKGALPCYWLRTLGDEKNSAMVNLLWSVPMNGLNVTSKEVAVRPALWINIDGVKSEKLKSYFELSKEEVKVGTHFILGKYEQDRNTDNGMEDIEWRVLKIKNGKALVITEYVLDCLQSSSSWNNANSNILGWLNYNFGETVFTNRERKVIELISGESSFNSINNTEDYILALNEEQLTRDYSSQYIQSISSLSSRVAKATPYAIAQGAYVDQHGYSYWWICSSDNGQDKALYITNRGEINESNYASKNSIAFRPAMWVDIP